MAHILGHDRSQMLLLPETVDDYVGPDHPVRFIGGVWKLGFDQSDSVGWSDLWGGGRAYEPLHSAW